MQFAIHVEPTILLIGTTNVIMKEKLIKIIEQAFSNISQVNSSTQGEIREAVNEVSKLLDSGQLRICEQVIKDGAQCWQVNQWLKKAVLLSFRLNDNFLSKQKSELGNSLSFYDKVALKFNDWNEDRFRQAGFRSLPGAIVRYSAFIAKNVVLMPSFVNVGAYVDEGSMIDSWATVGSCAQIGKNVHLSGGVGIGGVLEPLQASPVIIEDDAFIGSRCIVVEGVRVGKQAVLGANVVLTKSTKIIDVTGDSPLEMKGYVPERSVVIPGSYTKTFPAGDFQVPCALIIGKRKASTDLKTSLNDALREHNVAV